MIFKEGEIDGHFEIEVEKYEDDRGYFARTWCKEEFAEKGIDASFVQANVSKSRHAGTIRGMHYQTAPHQEGKLVRCIRGAIYDVTVDLREDSPTYMQRTGTTLTADRQNSVYVPPGCGHGVQALTDDAVAYYHVTSAYAPGHERGFRYDDPAFDITWPLKVTVVSEKDRSWPDFDARKRVHAASQ